MENEEPKDSEGQAPRRKGRPPRSNASEKFTVTLPPLLGEWAKDQPEGLSGLLTHLLQKEHDKRQASA